MIGPHQPGTLHHLYLITGKLRAGKGTGGSAGQGVTDRGDASGTGYFSTARGGWLPDLAASAIGHVITLPRVAQPAEVVGETAWGAALSAGTGDNMAAALGVGLAVGDVAVSIGTSGTVYSVSDRPTADPSGIVAGFADATGRHLPLVCTLNATKVTEAVRRLLDVDHATFDELALAAPPGAGGLTLLPYLDGERTPDRPDATGLLAGLRSDVTREQLARAAVEGVVCGLLDGLDALRAFAPAGGRLVLVGGGARSRAYRQVLADLGGRAVLVPHSQEQVATGACVQAAAAAAGADPSDVAARWGLGEGDIVEPGPGSTATADVRGAYAALRDR